MLIPGIAAFFLMKKEKKALPEGKTDETPLEAPLFWYVLILNFLAPIIASSVFYYGWKKRLPKKAKTANNLGWLSILFWIVIYFFVPGGTV
ncbi:hypothetical protein IPN35_00085 [Candidatus Peregrinibacteria bacterium]|nr:MAG: hypothetical protein IPN35_00085 [Candidatus Peregrinibacteria bacterium]